MVMIWRNLLAFSVLLQSFSKTLLLIPKEDRNLLKDLVDSDYLMIDKKMVDKKEHIVSFGKQNI